MLYYSMIKDMKIGTRVKAVNNMFYVTRDNLYEDWCTQEEIMSQVSQIIEVGDVYKFNGSDWECVEGSMLGEFSDGWFEMSSMIEKGVFEVVESTVCLD